MVLADLGKKLTSAIQSLGNSTIIDEEVRLSAFPPSWLVVTADNSSLFILIFPSFFSFFFIFYFFFLFFFFLFFFFCFVLLLCPSALLSFFLFDIEGY